MVTLALGPVEAQQQLGHGWLVPLREEGPPAPMPACNQQEKGHRGSGSSQDSELESRGGILAKRRKARGVENARGTAGGRFLTWAGRSWRQPHLRPSACAELWPEPQDAQDEGAGRHDCEPVTCGRKLPPAIISLMIRTVSFDP